MTVLEKQYKTNGERVWELVKKQKGLTAKEVSEAMGNYDKERVYTILNKLIDNPIDGNSKLIRIKVKRNPENIHSRKIINKYVVIKKKK